MTPAEEVKVLRAEVERLQTIINNRPAVSERLMEEYIKWSIQIYYMDFVRASETPQ